MRQRHIVVSAMPFFILAAIATACATDPTSGARDATEIVRIGEKRILACGGWTFAVHPAADSISYYPVNSSFTKDFYVVIVARNDTTCFNSFGAQSEGKVLVTNPITSPSGVTFGNGYEEGDSVLVTGSYVGSSTAGKGWARMGSAVGGAIGSWAPTWITN